MQVKERVLEQVVEEVPEQAAGPGASFGEKGPTAGGAVMLSCQQAMMLVWHALPCQNLIDVLRLCDACKHAVVTLTPKHADMLSRWYAGMASCLHVVRPSCCLAGRLTRVTLSCCRTETLTPGPAVVLTCCGLQVGKACMFP